MTRTLSALALLLALALPASAQKIAVTGGKTDQTNAVVVAPLPAGVLPSREGKVLGHLCELLYQYGD